MARYPARERLAHWFSQDGHPRRPALTPERADAAEQWISASHPRPERLAAEWQRPPRNTALVPAGCGWDAVALPCTLAAAASAELSFEQRADLEGTPLLCDLDSQLVYIPVAPRSADRWGDPAVTVLSHDDWLVMPHPRHPPTGHRAMWISLPDGSGRLADVRVLRLAVAQARARQRAPRPLVRAGYGVHCPGPVPPQRAAGCAEPGLR
ncbi:hypothetical protein [Streptomyces zagrosensis]|uniref:DNA primase/polymerase bifunctional N-terminal domain-containing protein n=1 Tax=Streptomyces zagrosensis TaxID=1042984 RepID=A0A7W9QBT2_9ACTN|nr:hypothetical protein [Streptomyces zagrosensis]MBB5937014.1 hypothetical protein [Streptomyces zagrosensis]